MPHFTLQISASGPIVNAIVAVSQPRAAALKAAGGTIPAPVTIRALIDTGASSTCIDPSVLTQLQLPQRGATMVNTPTTGATPVSIAQYDVALVIPAGKGDQPLVFQTIPVIACELLQAQGIHALIGRDILAKCVLMYNAASSFTIAY